MYKINNIDLATFGIIPIKGDDDLSVVGLLDFPARKGESERSWGVETEVFVSLADLAWAERDLMFQGLIRAATNAELLTRITAFSGLCKSDLAQFETPYGIFGVLLKNDIRVSPLSPTAARIDVNFTQPTVVFPALTQTASGGTGYRLAGYNLKTDFGIYISENSGQRDTPSRIEINTTDMYLKTTYREPKDITLSCFMVQPNISQVVAKMGQFQALLASAGLKAFVSPENESNNVYVKDGFKVSLEIGGKTIALFNLKLRAV